MNDPTILQILQDPNSAPEKLHKNIFADAEDSDLEERLNTLIENPVLLLLQLENCMHPLFTSIAVAKRNLTFKKLKDLISFVSWDRLLLVKFVLDKYEQTLPQIVISETDISTSVQVLKDYWEKERTYNGVILGAFACIRNNLVEHNNDRLRLFSNYFETELSEIDYNNFHSGHISGCLYYIAGLLAYKDYNDATEQHWFLRQEEILYGYMVELHNLTKK